MLETLVKRATQVQKFLDELHIPNVFIGGIANAFMGTPRNTIDADILVLVADENIGQFIDSLSKKAHLGPQNPLDFAITHRVIPAVFPNGLRVDFILAGVDFEKEAIRRAVVKPADGRNQLRVATSEDLVIMKMISTRTKDRDDIREIMARQVGRLDYEYIRSWLKQFEQILDRSDILQELNKLAK